MSHSTSFSLISLGCARSLVDSEKMVQKLHGSGFRLVNEGTGEPITILNTCSFIQSAIDETEDNIRSLIHRKRQGRIQYLVVSGCYPSRFKLPQLEARFPEVDLWLTTLQEEAVHQKISEMVFKRRFAPKSSMPYVKLTPTHYAYLKISEGCNNWCSFCTIPKIRGEHKSKPLEDLLAEAQIQLNLGVKELILIAEDTTAWGEDIYGKPSLPLLLTELSKLSAPWIRLMYIFPSRVNDELIRVVKNTPTICNYLDMPVQHVNSEILKQMRRRHDKAYLETLIQDMKREIPDLALRTTFILGFPGETQEHVHELLEFIERVPFDHLGCFAYSEERETLSYRFENKVDTSVTRKRIQSVMEKQFNIIAQQNKFQIGKTYECLYEGNGVGRTYREAPDVDGRIVLDETGLKAGEFYSVTITDAKGYDLQGQARVIAPTTRP